MKDIKPILQYFDEEYEYPSNEQLLHGIQPGVLFSYVASTYLQGFINCVDIEAAVLLNRYSETDEEFQKQIDSIKKEVAEQNEVHTSLYDYDDILILGNTKDMYVVFWSDGDVSDCNIGGLSLDTFESLSDAICKAHEMQSKGELGSYSTASTKCKKTGKWISGEFTIETGCVRCSQCNAKFYVSCLQEVGDENGFAHFCPACGCKMEREII